MTDDKPNSGNDTEEITLSAALLAPINSIFEAQVHSARAFLSFILQMGFRHAPTRKDFDSDEKFVAHMIERKDKKKQMRELLKKRKEEGTLSETEVATLKDLVANYGDLYHQSIDFVDDSGNEFQVNIPNLALLPIKPLAISEANFSYKFQVGTDTTTYKQNGAAYESPEDDKGSPWFLIKDPKSIRGGIAKRKEDSTERTIEINMKIGNTELPYGLEKLLVHLTNTIESYDTNQE